MNGRAEIVLSNGKSSDVSNLMELAFRNMGYSKERIIHYTFLLENALYVWRKELPYDAKLIFCRHDTSHFVKISVELEGEKSDPFVIDLENSDELPIEVMKDRLESGVGTEIRYKYRNGKNCIHFLLPKMDIERNVFILNLLLLALPLALQGLMTNIAQHIDALMLGFMDAASMSAVSIAAKFSTIFTTSVAGLVVAETTLLAQFWGKRDRDTINKVSVISLGVVMLLSSAFFILTAFFPRNIMSFYTDIPALIENGIIYMRTVSFSYFLVGVYQMLYCFMRTTGRVKSSVVYSVFGCAVNVIFNAIFIFGLFGFPKMGARGAALTTVISSGLQVMLAALELSKVKAIRLDLKGLFDVPLIKLFIGKSWPVISQHLIWVVASNFIMAAFGHLGPDVMAASSLMMVIYGIFASLKIGLGRSAGILVGGSLGKNKLETAYSESVISIKVGVLIAIPIVLLFGLTAYLLRYMPLDLNDSVIGFMNVLTVVMALNLFACIMTEIINGSSNYAGGNARSVLAIDVVVMWCVMVPVSIVAIHCSWISAVVLLIALNIDEVIKTPFFLHAQQSRKWLKNLT